MYEKIELYLGKYPNLVDYSDQVIDPERNLSKRI